MAFPIDLTSVLTGATRHQLTGWRQTGLLVPEINPKRPPLYSYRDLVALRTIVRLRSTTSLQKVRKAFGQLDMLDLTEHPSTYQFDADQETIYVRTPDGRAIDLVMVPGREMLLSFEDVFGAFETRRGRPVVDFRNPRKQLQVNPGIMGGIPTIKGTRIPYDDIARVVDGDTVTTESVEIWYPTVTQAAARDALSFDEEVRSA